MAAVRAITLKRYDGAGTANGIGTITLTASVRLRFLYATAKYSAAPTQAGVTLALDSGKGAAYDCTLFTGSANVQNTLLHPSGSDIIIDRDDAFVLTAPAGGVGITSALTLYCEEML